MALRLQGGFTSVQTELTYVVNVHDSEYSGTVIPFDLTRDGLVESFDHDDKGRNHVLMTSGMEVRMIVKTAAIEDFIEDVVNSAEGRFLLEVLRGGEKYWYGYILPDQFTIQDIPRTVGAVLSLKAIDGIGRLKQIDYNNAGTSYSGKATFLDHLYNILAKIGFEDFYGATDPYLISYLDWWEENHTYDTSTDPFALSRFNHQALIKVDSSGDVVYTTAYDALKELVKVWGCRFLFSDGTYKLIQVNSYKTDGNTKVLRIYDKSKGFTTESTADFGDWNKWTGNLNRFQDGTYDCYHNRGNFKYYAALRQAEVQYEHFATDNLIPGQIWTQATAQTATFADIDFNDGAARLLFTAEIESRADWTDVTELEILTYWFQIQYRVGDYYLVRGYTFNAGQYVYKPFEWTTTPGYVDIFTEYMYTNDFPRYTEVSFVSPPLEEGGLLQVTITRAGAYNTVGEQVFTTSSDFTPYYIWSDVAVQIMVEGNLQDQTNIKLYTATNSAGSSNSKVEEIKTLIGDGPSLNTFGAIEVYDGAQWVASSAWRKGNSGSYVEFGQLLANEIVAGQKKAVLRYLGTITGDYAAHHRLRRVRPSTVENYMFIGGRHNIHQDTWEGEWVLIDVDNVGIVSQPIRRYTGFPRDLIVKPPKPNLNFPTEEPVKPRRYSGINSPVKVTIDDFINKDIPLDEIPIVAIENPGYLSKGDEIYITTPLGERIPVRVREDVMPGDTVVLIEPITPTVDIPLGSVISVAEEDLFAYVQTSRRKSLSFFSDIRVTDVITTGDPVFFFRVDASSTLYLSRAVQLEVQVREGGSGNFTYQLKHEGTLVVEETVADTTEIERVALDYNLDAGLYTFHIVAGGTVPNGVNFLLDYIEPLQKETYIAPPAEWGGEYPGDDEAFAGGVLTNQLYEMSVDNFSGMPHGLLVRNYAGIAYASDEVAPVAVGAWYAVSVANSYGMKGGAIRIKSYSGTMYADDTAAAAGSVAVGAYYVLSAANPWGVPSGFVKVRKF